MSVIEGDFGNNGRILEKLRASRMSKKDFQNLSEIVKPVLSSVKSKTDEEVNREINEAWQEFLS
jgi:hypothetical protein